GAKIAAEVARTAVMPLERAGGQAQFIVHKQPTDDHTSIGKLLTWIEQNPSSDLSLPVIARRAAMSIRTLSRHFRAQVVTTPANWISRARVRSAQALLETTQLAVERVLQSVALDQPRCCANTSPKLLERVHSLIDAHSRAERREHRNACSIHLLIR